MSEAIAAGGQPVVVYPLNSQLPEGRMASSSGPGMSAEERFPWSQRGTLDLTVQRTLNNGLNRSVNSQLEDDTHADIWCLRANFGLLCYTRQSELEVTCVTGLFQSVALCLLVPLFNTLLLLSIKSQNCKIR